MKKVINSILYRIKENTLKKRSGKLKRKVEYKEWKDIKNCLVFWTAHPDQNLWLDRLPSVLKGIKIEKLCIVPSGTEGQAADGVIWVRDEELGFGGKIRNEGLEQILATSYDLLIDLTVPSTVLGNYILLNVRADFMVGMKKDNSLADIVIDGPDNPKAFTDQLTEILSAINKY